MSLDVSAIVYCQNKSITETVRSSCKPVGINTIHVATTVDECILLLIDHPHSILCIEWQLGSEVVNKILTAAQGAFKVEVRPILLFVGEIDHQIVSVGYEYGVTRINEGEVTPTVIQDCLREMHGEYLSMQPLIEQIVLVAEAQERGEIETAYKLLTKLKGESPDSEHVVVELANTCIQMDNWDEATALVQPLADLEPPRIRALQTLARCRLHAGEPDEAIGLMERARILNPHNVERLIDLGNAFLGVDEVEKAQDTFEEATRIDPANKEAKEGTGKCMLVQGDVNDALSLLKSVSTPRELASIFNGAAILSIKHDRFAKGMALYQSAMSAVKGDDFLCARLFFNMGIGYKRQQKWDLARACFAKAIELDSGYEKGRRNKEFCETKMMAAGMDLGAEPGKQLGDTQPKPGIQGDDDYVSLTPGGPQNPFANLGDNLDFDAAFGDDDDDAF